MGNPLVGLARAYERRCAYLAMYIHHATGSPTVDHVLPANYRLRGDHQLEGPLLSLVDPFAIGLGWFALNLNTLHVGQGPAAPQNAGRVTASPSTGQRADP